MMATRRVPEHLEFQTASAALRLLHAGELSVVQLAEACLRRVAARDADIKAWAYVDAEQVLAEARHLDRLVERGGERGPLHGVPVGIKDVLSTRGLPTQYNSPIYKDFRPAADAAAVTLLRAAGALIFGKTTTVEFGATGRKPPTCNPHNPSHTPGGSSSGSAAAVADFHVPLALATQTGGSIIRPASFCGIYGMKPTYGSVSNEGAKCFAPSLDTIGWMARSAADLALLYSVLVNTAEPVPDFSLSGARVGLCYSPAWADAEPATQRAMATAAARLRDGGAQVGELQLPAHFSDLLAHQNLIMRSEGGRSFLAEYRTHADLLDADLRAQVENARDSSPRQLLLAQDAAARCRTEFDAEAANFDVIVTPSSTGTAPAGLASSGHWTFNAMWTLLHVPCINVPGLKGHDGMPVGLTLTGPRWSDARLLSAAAAIGAVLADPERA